MDIEDRKQKADYIKMLYTDRSHTQEDIAKKSNYKHTMRKNLDNLKEEESLNLFVRHASDEFSFLEHVVLSEE